MIIFSDSKNLAKRRKEILQLVKLEAKVCENDEKTYPYSAQETNSDSPQNSTSPSACSCDAGDRPGDVPNGPSSILHVQSNPCYADICV